MWRGRLDPVIVNSFVALECGPLVVVMNKGVVSHPNAGLQLFCPERFWNW